MKIALVLGTRPEIIKLAPIIKKIGPKNQSDTHTVDVIARYSGAEARQKQTNK